MEIKYSSHFPEILSQLGITLAVSTYQSGSVVLISSIDGKHLIQFAKKLKRPMGIALGPDHRMAIACKETTEVFGTHKKLALTYKKSPRTYDGMYFPRATYYTGLLDLHDMEWEGDRLIGVNTAFSCLVEVNSESSFTPVWTPSFISEYVPEDRCHLNGLAIDHEEGYHYVSMMGISDEKGGWRKNRLEGGLIMRTEDEKVLVDALPMPHSPRLIDGKLFFLLSASGDIYTYDFDKEKADYFASVEGFVRGMSHHGDFLFVGFSAMREGSEGFRELPIAQKAPHAGVSIFQLSTGKKVAELYYLNVIKEIFDVAVIPDMKRGVIFDKGGKVAHRAVYIDNNVYYWKKEEEETEEDSDKIEHQT